MLGTFPRWSTYSGPVDDEFETCVVFLLGYPGVGKRTVGSELAEILDGVLVDNQLINIPLLTLFKWDGKSPIPMEIWDRVAPIREAVLGHHRRPGAKVEQLCVHQRAERR